MRRDRIYKGEIGGGLAFVGIDGTGKGFYAGSWYCKNLFWHPELGVFSKIGAIIGKKDFSTGFTELSEQQEKQLKDFCLFQVLRIIIGALIFGFGGDDLTETTGVLNFFGLDFSTEISLDEILEPCF